MVRFKASDDSSFMIGSIVTVDGEVPVQGVDVRVPKADHNRSAVGDPDIAKLDAHTLSKCTVSTMSLPGPAGASRRARGEVRALLVSAAVEMAREGGPDAVVLREATRRAGVVPNAAYRHFADRDELLNAVCVAAMRSLATQMHAAVDAVSGRAASKRRAAGRLDALGRAYLEFALDEPGLFAAAFGVPRHLDYTDSVEAAAPNGFTPFQLLGRCLDEARDVGLMPTARRAGAEFPVWAAVHGMAMLVTQGPLRDVPAQARQPLIDSLLPFIRRAL